MWQEEMVYWHLKILIVHVLEYISVQMELHQELISYWILETDLCNYIF